MSQIGISVVSALELVRQNRSRFVTGTWARPGANIIRPNTTSWQAVQVQKSEVESNRNYTSAGLNDARPG